MTITGSYNTGSVTASSSTSAYAGGLVGFGSSMITDSYNTGSVTSSSLMFTVSPDEGYVISSVTIDGVPQEIVGNEYVVYNVQKNISIAVTFTVQTFTVTASAGENGMISPSGDVTVDFGDDSTFTVTAEEGYKVSTVKVDGNDAVLTDGKYTFTNVRENHTIEVTFVANESPGGGGDNTMIFVAVGVIAAVAVLGVVYFMFIRKP